MFIWHPFHNSFAYDSAGQNEDQNILIKTVIVYNPQWHITFCATVSEGEENIHGFNQVNEINYQISSCLLFSFIFPTHIYTHTVLVSFLQNTAIAFMHIPPLPLHPLVSSCQTQVQKLLSSGSHMASDVPKTLHGVWVQNKDAIGFKIGGCQTLSSLHVFSQKTKSMSLQVTVSG